MIWHRGSNGERRNRVAGLWYAADEEYAAFYGGEVESIDDAGLRVLDLTEMGVGGEWDEETETCEPEVYDRVERMAAKLSRRYDAVRCLQWHADYSEEPQDTLFIFTREA